MAGNGATKPGDGSGRKPLLLAAIGAAVLIGILVAASLLFRGGDGDAEPTTPTGAISRVAGLTQNGTVLGDPAAKVTLLQYEDMQCPVCQRYDSDALPAIIDEYVRPGKVKLDFRGLHFIGDDSTKALRIVLAAAKQNKAWELIELLYSRQGEENGGWVTDELIDELVAQVPGLDTAQLLADAATPEITTQMDEISAEAVEREVQGTPWFFIAIDGAVPYEVRVPELTPDAFRPVLDDALR